MLYSIININKNEIVYCMATEREKRFVVYQHCLHVKMDLSWIQAEIKIISRLQFLVDTYQFRSLGISKTLRQKRNENKTKTKTKTKQIYFPKSKLCFTVKFCLKRIPSQQRKHYCRLGNIVCSSLIIIFVKF